MITRTLFGSVLMLNATVALTVARGDQASLPADQAFEQGNPFALIDLESRSTEPSKDAALHRGYLAASFRDADTAARELQEFVHQNTDAALRKRALTFLTSALFRERRYAEVRPYLEELVAEARKEGDAETLRDTEQTLAVAVAIEPLAPQETVLLMATELPRTVDRAGLTRLPALINSLECSAVFDTGANLCVASEGFARKHGLWVATGTVEVQAATGKTVRARVGLAKSLALGECLFRNVPFLVFRDDDLTFEEIHYTIEVILGFPVISELKTVRVRKTGSVSLAFPRTRTGIRNLALDGLSPLIAVEMDGRAYPFLLDTGATHTSLTEGALISIPTLAARARTSTGATGGAGGVVKGDVQVITDLSLLVAGLRQTLPSVHVTPNTQDSTRFYFGTIGTDILLAGVGYELDFREMEFSLLEAKP